MKTCQYFTGPRQFRKNLKRKLFRDDTDNVVPRLGQLMAHGFYFGFTMVLPELVRFFSKTSANILPALDSSGKISSQGCLAMTRTILPEDSASWCQHAFCCDFASISTNANRYLSQSLIVAWLIFCSSSTPNLSLATGPILSRDLFYAWAIPEYRDSLTSAGLRLRLSDSSNFTLHPFFSLSSFDFFLLPFFSPPLSVRHILAAMSGR